MNYLGRYVACSLLLIGASLVRLPQSQAEGQVKQWWHATAPESEQAAVFSRPIGMIGIWRETLGKQAAPEFGLSFATAAARAGDAGDQRVIADFERDPMSGTYALVYATGEAQQELLTHLDDLAAAVSARKGTQFLADFELVPYFGKQSWTALFTTGSKAQTFAPKLSGADLQKKVDQGQHLADIEFLEDGPDGARFAAVFDSEPVPQQFFASLSEEDFHRQIHQSADEGFRLDDVETWISSQGEVRLTALFVKTPGKDHVWVLEYEVEEGEKPADWMTGSIQELLERFQKLTVESPKLQLVDLEMPCGGPFDGQKVFTPAATSRGRTPKGGSGPKRPGSISNPVPVIPNHSPLLHDAGSDGPTSP